MRRTIAGWQRPSTPLWGRAFADQRTIPYKPKRRRIARKPPMPAQTAELEDFRAEVRVWLDGAFPKSLAGRAPQAGEPDPKGEEVEAWKAQLCGRGWGTPTWPKEYGGGGLSPQQ